MHVMTLETISTPNFFIFYKSNNNMVDAETCDIEVIMAPQKNQLLLGNILQNVKQHCCRVKFLFIFQFDSDNYGSLWVKILNFV